MSVKTVKEMSAPMKKGEECTVALQHVSHRVTVPLMRKWPTVRPNCFCFHFEPPGYSPEKCVYFMSHLTFGVLLQYTE